MASLQSSQATPAGSLGQRWLPMRPPSSRASWSLPGGMLSMHPTWQLCSPGWGLELCGSTSWGKTWTNTACAGSKMSRCKITPVRYRCPASRVWQVYGKPVASTDMHLACCSTAIAICQYDWYTMGLTACELASDMHVQLSLHSHIVTSVQPCRSPSCSSVWQMSLPSRALCQPSILACRQYCAMSLPRCELSHRKCAHVMSCR